MAACLYLDVLAEGITLSKGLGSRHWAAAAISRSLGYSGGDQPPAGQLSVPDV